jgi:hypothetical protein
VEDFTIATAERVFEEDGVGVGAGVAKQFDDGWLAAGDGFAESGFLTVASIGGDAGFEESSHFGGVAAEAGAKHALSVVSGEGECAEDEREKVFQVPGSFVQGDFLFSLGWLLEGDWLSAVVG